MVAAEPEVSAALTPKYTIVRDSEPKLLKSPKNSVLKLYFHFRVFPNVCHLITSLPSRKKKETQSLICSVQHSILCSLFHEQGASSCYIIHFCQSTFTGFRHHAMG